jgi:hypothetical protein
MDAFREQVTAGKKVCQILSLRYVGYSGNFLTRFGAMRSRDLSQHLYRIIAVCLCLCSCHASFFGSDLRELAGGYRLKRVGNSNQFALIIPNQNGGLIVDEIGWHKPFIIARSSGSNYWEAINTARAHRISISDIERKTDPVYQSIQIESAEAAWTKLNRHNRLW